MRAHVLALALLVHGGAEAASRQTFVSFDAPDIRPSFSFDKAYETGLMLSLTGVAIGLVGAWWLGRAGSSLLFGVTASDPLTFTTVSLLLTAVAIAACYFPARRAMRVDPIVALRVT